MSIPTGYVSPRASTSASSRRKSLCKSWYCPWACTDPRMLNVRPRRSTTVTLTTALSRWMMRASSYALRMASSSSASVLPVALIGGTSGKLMLPLSVTRRTTWLSWPGFCRPEMLTWIRSFGEIV